MKCGNDPLQTRRTEEMNHDLRNVIESVFRRESGKIIAGLIRVSGSFDLAEEAMQDAFAAALVHW